MAAPLADHDEDDVSEFVLIYGDLSGFLKKRIILPENFINSSWVSEFDDKNITYRESRVNKLIKLIDDLVVGSLYAAAKMIHPKISTQ